MTTSLRSVVAATASTLLVVLSAAAPAVAAPGDPATVLPNGCVIVEAPTVDVHTVCRGLVFDDDDLAGFTGQNLDFADFSQSTFTVPFTMAVESARKLVLDDATYDTTTTTWGALAHGDAPVSVASARYAHITNLATPGSMFSWTPASFVNEPGAFGTHTWSGAPQHFTGADFTGAVLEGTVMGVSFADANFTDATFDTTVFSGLIFTGATFNNTHIHNTESGFGDNIFEGVNAVDSSISVDPLSSTPWFGTYTSDLGSNNFNGVNFTVGHLHLADPYVSLTNSNLDRTVWDGMSFVYLDLGGSQANMASFNGVTVEASSKAPTWARNTDFSNFTVAGPSADTLAVDWMNPYTIAGVMDFSGGDYMGSTFTGLTAKDGVTFRGANLTSSNWAGVDLSNTAVNEPNEPTFDGANLSFSNFDGANLPLGSGTAYYQVSAVGTTFFTMDPASPPYMARRVASLFEQSDLTGATFRDGVYNGMQFLDSTMDGVVFDGYATVSGATWLRTSAVGMDLSKIHVSPDYGPPGLSGINVVNSDFSDTRWPAAANNPADPAKWLYALRIIDSELGGSDLAPADLTFVVADARTPGTFTFTPTNVWVNDDNQNPFAADGGYWWGAKLVHCDVPSGSALPVGVTTVTCQVGMDNQANMNPTTWDTEEFHWGMLDPAAGQYVVVASRSFDDVNRVNPAAPTLTPTSTKWQLAGYGSFQGEWYMMGDVQLHTDADQVTLLSLPVSFDVAVESEPLVQVAATGFGVAGEALQLPFTGVGFPTPTVTVTGLPAGVTQCGSTEVDDVTVEATLCGVVDVDQYGWHSVTVTVQNVHGVDSATVDVFVAAAGVEFNGDPTVMSGSTVDVRCVGLVPDGDVLLTVTSAGVAPVVVGLVAGADGSTPWHTITPPSPAAGGVAVDSDVSCLDVTTGSVAVSAVTVLPPVMAPLASTGFGGTVWVVLSVVCMVAGATVLVVGRVRGRRTARHMLAE